MPGPAPIPTRIKKARGNPGKQRLNEQEPQPAETTAEAPAFLTLAEKALWDEHAPELVRMGLLTAVDRQEFTAYCKLRAYALEQFRTRDGEGSFSRAMLAFTQSSALARQFGIGGPASRAKLTSQPQATASKWAGLMKRSA